MSVMSDFYSSKNVLFNKPSKVAIISGNILAVTAFLHCCGPYRQIKQPNLKWVDKFNTRSCLERDIG